MRKFEKISEKQFCKDVEVHELYNNVQIPTRSTKNSACYDLRAIGYYEVGPGQVVKIPTGLKVAMEPNEVFLMFIRSSIATKHGITLTNNVGVIDADYYNNPDNEGHFWIVLRNESDTKFTIENGDRLCQGMFVEYKVTDDDNADGDRVGGFGSTGRSE